MAEQTYEEALDAWHEAQQASQKAREAARSAQQIAREAEAAFNKAWDTERSTWLEVQRLKPFTVKWEKAPKRRGTE